MLWQLTFGLIGVLVAFILCVFIITEAYATRDLEKVVKTVTDEDLDRLEQAVTTGEGFSLPMIAALDPSLQKALQGGDLPIIGRGETPQTSSKAGRLLRVVSEEKRIRERARILNVA